MTEILFRLRLPVLLTKVVGLSTLTGKLCCFHLKDVKNFCSSRRWKSEIEPQESLLYMKQMNAMGMRRM